MRAAPLTFRRALLGASYLLLASIQLIAQPLQVQRDKPAPKPGTSAIRGRVLAAGTNSPIRRATVSLQAPNPLDAYTTTTDLEGRYEFTELPSGEYRLSASKGTFVPTEYGQRRPFERGKAIKLEEGEDAEKIDIVLSRGVVITGTLLDDVGDPAVGVPVTLMRAQFSGGKRRLVGVRRPVETNDVGQYRVYGVAPGTYFLAALPTTANPQIPVSSAPAGAPTYYPGTVNEMEAQRVSVQTAHERTLADFALVPSRLAKVSGIATTTEGTPAEVVMLMSTAQIASAGAIPGMKTASVRPDGSFQLSNVPPGEYAFIAGTTNKENGEQEITSQLLTVAGEDIRDLMLSTTKGFRATGQVLVDQLPPPSSLIPSRLTVSGAPLANTTMSGMFARATLRDDWTFELKGLAGQRKFLIIQGLPPEWTIASVAHGQTDITDKPVEVTQDLDGIVITLTNRGAKVRGTVIDDRAKPVNDCSILIFPEDPALGPPTTMRYVRALRPSDSGVFSIDKMPAGNYMIAAVPSVDEGDEGDPELLEQLRLIAVRLSLGWGDTREVPLKLVAFERR
jgi:hypothetical protein